jgi:hypothetical protein
METRTLTSEETEIHGLLLLGAEHLGLVDESRAYLFEVNNVRGKFFFGWGGSVSTEYQSWTIHRQRMANGDMIDEVVCPDLVEFERDMIYLKLILS